MPQMVLRRLYLLFVGQYFHFVSKRASVNAVLGGEDDDAARAQRSAAPR